MKRKIQKGFTLVELIVVIVIIGILAAVLIPSLTGYIDKAKRATDIALVKNINTIIEVDDILYDYNNAASANNIIERIEEAGLELVTKSKNAYLFFNLKTNRVELADIDSEKGFVPITEKPKGPVNGFVKVEQENIQDVSINEFMTSPETIFKGYFMIGKKSHDGFAEAINTLRNATSLDDFAEALNVINKSKKLPASLKTSVNAFVDNTIFTTVDSLGNTIVLNPSVYEKDGNFGVIESTNSTNNVIFSQTLNTLDVNTIKKINEFSPQIVEIPANIKNISKTDGDGFEDELKKLTTNSVVVTTKDFITLLESNNIETDSIKADIVLDTDRDTAVKNVVIKKYIDVNGNLKEIDGIGSNTIESSSKQVKINASYLMEPSSNASTAYELLGLRNSLDFTGSFINVNNLKKEYIKETVTNTYLYNFTAVDNINTDQDGNLILYAIYKERKPNVKVGNNYFVLSDGIEYASGNGSKDEIYVLGNTGSITRNLILDKNDTLRLPMKENDNIAYDDLPDTYLKNAEWYTNKQSKLNAYSEISINSDFYVNGRILVGGYHYSHSGQGATSHLTGNHGVIRLGKNGNIYVRDGGNITNYGAIYGSQDKTQVYFQTGSRLNSMMKTTSFNGGSNAMAYTGSVFQFGNYAMEGLFVKSSFEYDSVLNAQITVHLSIPQDAFYGLNLNMITPSTSKNKGVFVMNPGSVMTYSDDYKTATNETIIEVLQGKVDIVNFKFGVEIIGLGVSVDTSLVELPISGNYHINVKNNAELFINNHHEGPWPNYNITPRGVKLMPGSSINIEDGGKLTIKDSGLSVYEWSDNPTGAPSKTHYGYNNHFDSNGTTITQGKFKDDAKLIVNGKLEFIGKTNFNGRIYSDKTKEEVIIGTTSWNKTLTECTPKNRFTANKFTVYATKDGKSHFVNNLTNEDLILG